MSKIVGLDGKFLVKLLFPIKKIEHIVADIEGSFVPFRVCNAHFIEDGAYLNVTHLKSREDLNLLKGRDIYLEKDYLDDKEKKIYKLIGYQIIATSNTELIGEVYGIANNSLSIVLMLKNNKRDNIMIPYTPEFIEKIDHKLKKAFFNLPEGLTLD